MKSTILTLAFLMIGLVSYSQKKPNSGYGAEKANYNTTRSNKAQGIMDKGEESVEKVILEIKTNNGRASKAMISSGIERQLKAQKVEMSKDEISELSEYINKISSAVNSNENVQKIGGIEIEIKFRRFSIIIRIG